MHSWGVFALFALGFWPALVWRASALLKSRVDRASGLL